MPHPGTYATPNFKPTFQPLSRTNPLARGLVVCAPHWEGSGPSYNLTDFAQATLGSAGTGWTWTGTSMGLAQVQALVANTEMHFGNLPKYQFGHQSSVTYLSIATVDGSAGSARNILNKNTGGVFATFVEMTITTGNVLRFRLGENFGGTGQLDGTTSISVVSHVPRFFGATRAPGSIALYLDGRLEASGNDGTAATLAWTASGGNMAIGTYDGKRILDLVWDRALSESEMMQMYINPWQIFARTPAMLFPGAGGTIFPEPVDIEVDIPFPTVIPVRPNETRSWSFTG